MRAQNSFVFAEGVPYIEFFPECDFRPYDVDTEKAPDALFCRIHDESKFTTIRVNLLFTLVSDYQVF